VSWGAREVGASLIAPVNWSQRAPVAGCFVLGDHRNLSNDSRDFGPVSERYIYGKAAFVYWPLEKIGTLR
jgi:signal peptidase I